MGRGQGHMTSVNFWELSADISKMVKATDFKFEVKFVSNLKTVAK